MSRRVPCAVLALSLLATPALAADKNGVSPNVISLPAGPGSIEGLGESFQPLLNTGTARYAVKIPLPKLHNTPELALQYESGFGDGPAGIGWVYGPGSIARQVDKGLPRYVDGPNEVDDDADGFVDETDESDIYVGPDGEELVPVGGGVYRARIEGGFARYRKLAAGWEVTLRNGTRVDFGTTAAGRVANTAGTKVFRWLPERSTDTNGNVIDYRWEAFAGSESQKYLREIRYGPGAPPWGAFYFASFTYEDKPDWRADYRSGFLVRTAKRLTRLEIGIQGTLPAQCAVGDWNGDGTQDALISRYAIAYDAAHPVRSFLAKITRYGADGVNYLPPISFSYAAFDPPGLVEADALSFGTENAPLTVMDSDLVELVDLNRDALPDILQTDREGGLHKAYLNLGADSLSGGRVRWDEGRFVGSEDGHAPLLQLAEKRVHLADMDGDGIADLVHTTAAGEVLWHPNGGDADWKARRSMSLADSAPPAPFTTADAAVADLDFDKRMDVVLSTEAGYAIWFNRAGDRYSREMRTPGARHGGAVLRFSQTGVHLADMNGDRLADVVRVTPTRLLVAAGMGHGHFAPAVEVSIPGATLTDGADGQIARARLEDVDGDGLADLVIERAEPGELHCWLNRGTDALGPRIVVTGMPMLYGVGTAVRWADLNGNGSTDLVYADSAAGERLRVVDIGRLLGGTAHPNLLTRIDNGLGVATAITWRPSTVFMVAAGRASRPWASTIPFPVQVVFSVDTTTGMDLDDAPGPDLLRKEFAYRDGFYEDRERAFRGFAQVRVTEPGDASAPTRVEVRGFHTGGPDGADNDGDGQVDEILPGNHREEEALKGLLRFSETRSGTDVVYLREENDWRVRTLLAGTDGSEVRFAYRERSDTLHYEGTAAPETVRTTWSYDDFGNPTAERRLGALSINGDESVTSTEYINDTARWLIGLPSRRRVTDTVGAIFSETLSYYDGPGYAGLPLGQAEKGKLTRTLGRVRPGEYVETARHAYDAWGNVVGSLDPNGGLRTVSWDALLHAFPVREQIQVGGGNPDLFVTVEWNPGLGSVTATDDFNGHRSTFAFDSFGRLTSIVLPGDSEDFPTQKFSYTLTNPAAGLTYRYDQAGALAVEAGPAGPCEIRTRSREVSGQAGTLDASAYVDGLGRRLGTATEGETGFVRKEEVLFNAHGTPRKRFLPREEPSLAYARPPADAPATEFHYDPLGRETQRTNPPDALDVVTASTTAYLPLREVATDENLVPKELKRDGLGRLREIREHNGGDTYVTVYAYDAAGRLVRITDANANVRSHGYDGLGRRMWTEDPDGGRREHAYDAAGNLVRTTDNKRQTLLFSYDGANRLIAERHFGTAGLDTAAELRYDVPSPEHPDAANLRGRLAWVTDRSGGQFYSYDERGNAEWSMRSIVTGVTARTYRTSVEHDALGRPVARTFPDGDRVSYVYNSRGLLEAIPGVVGGLDYHPAGAIASVVYGNGVRTDYDFDARGRLRGLLTSQAAPGAPLQDLGYTLDGVNNVVAIHDFRTLGGGDPSDATREFTYDSLNRLITAAGPGFGHVDFGYDPIGNLVRATSPDAPDPGHIDDPLVNLGELTHGGVAGTGGRGVRMPGDAPGPHAVTGSASGLSFSYDDNGNMTANGGDAYEWDSRDRLVRATTLSTDSRYLYDHAGARVVKRVLDGGTERTTHYVDAAYEVREGRPVKHIFAGSRRVATVEGRLSGGGSTQFIAFEPGWNFFALEVEPISTSVAAVLASLSGAWTSVWEWDAAAEAYFGNVPALGILDLVELHARRGYLIHVTESCALEIAGTQPAADAVLAAGWNLAASPVDNAMSVEDAFAGILPQLEAVWGYDTAGGSWSAWLPTQPAAVERLAFVAPGRAYWVSLSGAATLPRQTRATSIRYYHPDHLGSSSLVTDAAGAPIERTEFHPFGRVRHEEAAGPASDYRFTGKERDRETGLDYFGARYYLPIVAKFVGLDPLEGRDGEPQGLNRYAYSANNPLSRVDPSGQDWKDWVEAISSNSIDYYVKTMTETVNPLVPVAKALVDVALEEVLPQEAKGALAVAETVVGVRGALKAARKGEQLIAEGAAAAGEGSITGLVQGQKLMRKGRLLRGAARTSIAVEVVFGAMDVAETGIHIAEDIEESEALDDVAEAAAEMESREEALRRARSGGADAKRRIEERIAEERRRIGEELNCEDVSPEDDFEM